jgi:hypothetical protein
LLNLERWDRNIRWLGEAAQQKIFNTTLAIFGCGGIGALFVQSAMHLGFSKFLLIDPDRVEPSNFNRLLGVRESDVGRYKVEFLKQIILSFNPQAFVKIFPTNLQNLVDTPGMLPTPEVLIGGLDNNLSRLALQLFAAQQGKPLLDLGSGIILSAEGTILEKGAQARFYIPGGPCLLCQGLKVQGYSETLEQARRAAGYVQNTDLSSPSVITLNAVIANIGLNMLISYLINPGDKHPYYLYYDELNYRLLPIEVDSDPWCPICGQDGVEKTVLLKK